MELSENIRMVKERMKKAANKAQRNIDDIQLIAVSKTQPAEKLIEARNLGLEVFGENRVQELVEKYPVVNDVKWHLIGHLQKNKVKYIIDKVEMIHSLDSLELAEEINKRTAKIGRVMPVLIQINIGKEDSKSGIYEEDINSFCEKLSVYENILVSGIMTIPPKTDNEIETRKYFRKMKQLFDELKNLKYDNFNIRYLSMGMTDDFDIAIEEGANIIRVGTGIFGRRE